VRAWILVATLVSGTVTPELRSSDAQRRPDFSGTWVLAPARSARRAAADKLVVRHDDATLRIVQFLCCGQAGEQWESTYYFNRWGPRNSRPLHRERREPRHDTKPTQVRWDGDALVMHAGPGQDRSGGSVRVWRLSAGGRELHESIVHRGLGIDFDFRESSISRFYARDRHVYVRGG
jgi:hypothetical protein